MTDSDYMKRALRLARRGEGYVEPNPMVGCVIVRDGRIVGEGWHKRFGGPHAEVEALRAAGRAARGAAVYVTLEPCPHHGKTPPCTAALIEAGVERVVIGYVDPTPGRGCEGVRRLEAAGVGVEVGPLGERAAALVEPFVKRTLTGLPYVIAKWAATADGAIATRTGDSRWISGERSRRLVHRMRGRVDAVVAGIGTVLADDPRLTARGVRRRRIARRVILDPNLKLPVGSRLVRTVGEAPLTLAVAERVIAGAAEQAAALRGAGVELLGLPLDPATGLLNAGALLRHLADRHGATNVLIEGGGRTLGAFIDGDLVDELMVFIGPVLLGDAGHRSPLVLPEHAGREHTIASARRLRLAGVRRIGDDVLLRYRSTRRP